jgi:hypothetical protein
MDGVDDDDDEEDEGFIKDEIPGHTAPGAV